MKPFGLRVEEAARAQIIPLPRPVAAVAAPDAGILLRLRGKIMERLDSAGVAEMAPEVLRAELEPVIHEIAGQERVQLSARDQTRLAQELSDDMVGFGPLEPLLRDESISDIMVNGPNAVFVEVSGKLQKSTVRFRDAEHAAMVAQKMVATVGRRVDESSPLCDARLPDGSRVNVIFPPLALDGPCISIRKFTKKKMDLAAMVANGSMNAAVARLLEIAARCRLNILVSGGTGSGKTTLLNAVSRMISPGERIITIEDAAELQLQQPHVVRLETRTANLEGRGEISQRELLRNALRMRPDRIIVGEVRGTEAYDMLQAMNTGHAGSISTVHANTPRDAISRVENMVQMAAVNLPARAIRTQIVSALDLIIQIERMRDGVRRISRISDICGMESEVITMNDVASFEFESEDSGGGIVGHYHSAMMCPSFADRLAYFDLERAWTDAMQAMRLSASPQPRRSGRG
jgi:pilus assembly protein CpaF